MRLWGWGGVVVAPAMIAASFAARAQVECKMPNGRAITLSLSHTCPVGAVGARSLDDGPVQIAQPTPATPKPIERAAQAKADPLPQKTAPVADGANYAVSRSTVFACSNRDYYERLVGLAVQGDREAFNKELLGGVLSGSCLTLNQGAPVYLEDTALFAGLVQIRPSGALGRYWTARENISAR